MPIRSDVFPSMKFGERLPTDHKITIGIVSISRKEKHNSDFMDCFINYVAHLQKQQKKLRLIIASRETINADQG